MYSIQSPRGLDDIQLHKQRHVLMEIKTPFATQCQLEIANGRLEKAIGQKRPVNRADPAGYRLCPRLRQLLDAAFFWLIEWIYASDSSGFARIAAATSTQ